MFHEFQLYNQPLDSLPNTNLLITTLNAHSYNVACKDAAFATALQGSDVILPDGISVVWAAWMLNRTKKPEFRTKTLKKLAGEDLFYWEMNRIESEFNLSKQRKAKAFFLGSSEAVLEKIKLRAAFEFPNIEVFSYSPPYKLEFSDQDNAAMVSAINAVNPDLLFVGMTAPKQEKWAYNIICNERLMGNADELLNPVARLKTTNCHICCIGAVFDFYAGTVQRAPTLFIRLGLEWFYRLLKEPRRMWRRYLIGNVQFVLRILKEL